MVQLIITLIAIALTSALALVTVTYVPWHARPAAEIASIVQASLAIVDSAYQVVARANAGQATDPGAGDAVAAFQTQLVTPVLKLTPASPRGYQWSYHLFTDAASPGSQYDGLNYVCLTPPPGLATDTALEMGFRRALTGFSSEQAILSNNCGDTSPSASFTSAPVLTFFLVPSPDNNL